MNKKLVQFLVICINITAIYCMMYHGLTDRFASTFRQIVAYFLLMGILSANTWLLVRKAKPTVEGQTQRKPNANYEATGKGKKVFKIYHDLT
ncbi:MAG TPA: hypothetical protein VG367_20505 [Mucilaginibacter sp.]|jgi:hypothetical protein|nr:hypothetical protein [Mucilaginibacter sp.]